jgi:hypothetical protein
LTASIPDAIATAIRTVLHDTGRSAREVESSMLLATDLGPERGAAGDPHRW